MGNTGFRIKTPPLCRRTARCLKKTICGLIIHNLKIRIKGISDIITPVPSLSPLIGPVPTPLQPDKKTASLLLKKGYRLKLICQCIVS